MYIRRYVSHNKATLHIHRAYLIHKIIQSCYTAADEVSLAADSSASGFQDPSSHTSSTDWSCT